MSTSDHLWLRPATVKEEYFEVGHQNNITQTCYGLSLKCRQALDDEVVRSALTHLYKKVPVLRLCLGRRDGQLWLRQMNHCNIDFKSVEDVAVEDEEEKLSVYTYNTAEGPMWCVRLLKDPTPETPSTQDPVFSHRYVLLFGIHHLSADGFTNTKICNLLHTLLDDLAACRLVDDEEQLGEHLGAELSDQLYEDERRKLLEDPELLRKCKEELLDITSTRPLLLDVLPAPRNEDVKTCTVNKHFEENITSSFCKKCKAEGVGLHSALTGLINVALTKVLEDLPEVPDEYEFLAGHDVNLRRYYTGNTSHILGVHIPTYGFKTSFRPSKDLLSNFWSSVKAFQAKFHSELNNRFPVRIVALRMMEKSNSEIIGEYFKTHGIPDSYYTVSNVGDLTSMIPGDGDNVKVTKLSRLSTLRSMTNFMCFYIHSYKGRLNVRLGFSTRFLDYEMANRILDVISTSIAALCQT